MRQAAYETQVVLKITSSDSYSDSWNLFVTYLILNFLATAASWALALFLRFRADSVCSLKKEIFLSSNPHKRLVSGVRKGAGQGTRTRNENVLQVNETMMNLFVI